MVHRHRQKTYKAMLSGAGNAHGCSRPSEVDPEAVLYLPPSAADMSHLVVRVQRSAIPSAHWRSRA